jgi:preprotein translocase subunit SecD
VARPTSGQSKPGRTLLVLLALILAMGGAMFLQPAFTPKLGLDLAGGTTATLSPVTPNGTPPSEESLNLAVNIIRERVNGTGISDAEVAKSGDNIVISVPGAGKDEVIKLVGTTAEGEPDGCPLGPVEGVGACVGMVLGCGWAASAART